MTKPQRELLERAALGGVPYWQHPRRPTVTACLKRGWLTTRDVPASYYRATIYITDVGRVALAAASHSALESGTAGGGDA